MYHAGIAEERAAPAPSLARAQATLATVASGLDARFVEAGSALAHGYEIVEKLVTALADVTNALDRDATDTAIGNMRATADRLARLPDIQARRAAALDEIRRAGATLRVDVAQIKRTLSFLRICGLNIKVAASGATEFDGFSEQMFDKLDVGEAEMERIAAEIDRLVSGIPDTGDLDRQLADECAKIIPHVPRQLAEDAQALQRHQGEVADRAARVADVARDLRGKVATAIGALQIGDITRQRLEHIADALPLVLGLVEDVPEVVAAQPVACHVIALLAAQAEDTLATFRREALVLAESLRGIGPSAAALLALRDRDDGAGQEDADDGVFLSKLEASVAEVESVTARLRDADARSHRLSGQTSRTAELLADRLRTVHRVTGDVQQMAWNTDLRSYRMGHAGRGLAVIASETRGFATKLVVISKSIGASFDRLTRAAAAIRDPDGAGGNDTGQALADSLACIRDAGDRMRAGMAGLDRDAERIVAILRDTTDKVDCEAEVTGALTLAVEDLAAMGRPAEMADAEAQALLATLLDRVAASYTMAREREIHRAFVPASATDQAVVESPAEAGDEDDDDLDCLF